MDDLTQKNLPDSPAANTVNQYGDHPVNINNIENASLYLGSKTEYDENGKPFTPLSHTRYDKDSGIIYLGDEKVKLPVQLAPKAGISGANLPYIDALCEVYAEKLSQAITPDKLDTLPKNLQRDLNDHKRAFYSADHIQHSVREVFADGEQQFNALKNDAYEGISPVYYDDSHATGYDRLKAVLIKITNTTLSATSLTNVIGLITNLEKKGICHILVNDDVIKSWVNTDE